MDHHGKQITDKNYDEAKMRTRQERVAFGDCIFKGVDDEAG